MTSAKRSLAIGLDDDRQGACGLRLRRNVSEERGLAHASQTQEDDRVGRFACGGHIDRVTCRA